MAKQLEIELIIFDMDGLMFDTEKMSYHSWKEAAGRFDYEISRELFEQTIGANIHKNRELYSAHFGEKFPFDLIVAERIKISDEMIKTSGVPLKKGLVELLEYLKSRKMKMALATSTSRKRALDLLDQVKLYDFFDVILCGDEIVHSKPDPEIFLKVAGKLMIQPSKCAVLEDSEAGILAAYQAGMMPIMIPDMKEPSEEIQRLLFKRMDHLLDVKVYLEEEVLMSHDLHLVKPSKDLEKDILAFRQEYLESGARNVNGTSGLIRYDDFDEWLELIQGIEKDKLSKQNVHASTFFSVRSSDHKIIGSIQLRHSLSPELEEHGGHIGYSVRPSERGKGYGKEQLRLVLDVAWEMNIPKVMISCYKENVASSQTAVSCGGVLTDENVYEGKEQLVYWITGFTPHSAYSAANSTCPADKSEVLLLRGSR